MRTSLLITPTILGGVYLLKSFIGGGLIIEIGLLSRHYGISTLYTAMTRIETRS